MGPSSQPSVQPSGEPSIEPSEYPSVAPTTTPSYAPTSTPSGYPSAEPTANPSSAPSSIPSESPSTAPTAKPSYAPSISTSPTISPSTNPTISIEPSAYPSMSPTDSPTSLPSASPTISTMPSTSPTMEIEPLRTLLKESSPSSAFELHDENSNQYRALYWLYYDLEKYDNYTNDEKIELWALGCFYYNTIGHKWYNSTNWMLDSGNLTVCDWYGLTCDGMGMVLEMDLAANRIQRDLPNEFTLLTKLQYLGLSDNSLGRLDPLLFEMPNLFVIDFDGNGIREIPDNIPKRNRVKELYLADNRIDAIPSSIVALQKLEVLWLWKNSLEGTLPSFLRGLSRLGECSIYYDKVAFLLLNKILCNDN
ncbi:hypothetical protein ACHAXR_006988 [Thalassiosira sp. AJA248-18]